MSEMSKEKAVACANTLKEKVATLWKSGKKGKCIIIVGALFLLGLVGSFINDEDERGTTLGETKTAEVSKSEKSAKKESEAVKTDAKSILTFKPLPKDFEKLHEKYCKKPPYFGRGRLVRGFMESLFEKEFRTPVTEEMAKVDPTKQRLTLFGGSLQLGDEFEISDEKWEVVKKLDEVAEEIASLRDKLQPGCELAQEEGQKLADRLTLLVLRSEFRPETADKVLALYEERKKTKNGTEVNKLRKEMVAAMSVEAPADRRGKLKNYEFDVAMRKGGTIACIYPTGLSIVNWEAKVKVMLPSADDDNGRVLSQGAVVFFDSGFMGTRPFADGSRIWQGPLPRPFKEFVGIKGVSNQIYWYQAPNSKKAVLFAVHTDKGDTESHEESKALREKLTKIVKDKHPGIVKGYSNECWEEYIFNGDMMKIEQQASAEQAGMAWASFLDGRPGITAYMIRPSIIAKILKVADEMEEKELAEARKLEAAAEKAFGEGF